MKYLRSIGSPLTLGLALAVWIAGFGVGVGHFARVYAAHITYAGPPEYTVVTIPWPATLIASALLATVLSEVVVGIKQTFTHPRWRVLLIAFWLAAAVVALLWTQWIGISIGFNLCTPGNPLCWSSDETPLWELHLGTGLAVFIGGHARWAVFTRMRSAPGGRSSPAAA